MKPIVILVLLALAGCQVGPAYHPPTHSFPAAFPKETGADAMTYDPSVPLAEWWQVFHDPQLTSLIQMAAAANLDVRLAAARVREARARRGISAAALYPQIGSTADYSQSRVGKHSLIGEQLNAFSRPVENSLFDVGLDMSWEIDVFGGTRQQVKADDARLAATDESRRDVLVTVLAEVGLSYLDLRGALRRLFVARENLRTQESTLAITQDRLKSGLAEELDVSRAMAAVATTRATLPPLEEARQQAVHRLDVLLGRNPGELDPVLGQSDIIPSAAPRVPVGLPSDLIRQRPDLRRAERELEAATADIGVATADLFPKFYLTGNVGLQSVEAHDFFDGGSRYWSFGPGIRWPIFQAGKIRRNIKVQDARQEQAALNYERILLNSLEEVQNALVGFGQEQERRRALLDAVAASQRSFTLAEDRYQGGLVGFLDVLEAQRSLLIAQDGLADSERQLSQNLIRVFKSLGGGWDSGPLATR